jgi:DNA helicase II / ATP-dependent DNA helicase PcrA
MPPTTVKKRPTNARPRRAKTAVTATNEPAPSEAERPVVMASDYKAGDLVSHPMFGHGTVTAVDANKLTIEFKDGRVKQIVDYYVKRRQR